MHTDLVRVQSSPVILWGPFSGLDPDRGILDPERSPTRIRAAHTPLDPLTAEPSFQNPESRIRATHTGPRRPQIPASRIQGPARTPNPSPNRPQVSSRNTKGEILASCILGPGARVKFELCLWFGGVTSQYSNSKLKSSICSLSGRWALFSTDPRLYSFESCDLEKPRRSCGPDAGPAHTPGPV